MFHHHLVESYQLTHDVEEIVIDGIMLFGPSRVEEWAKRATADHNFPRVPISMTESYLNSTEYSLARAEKVMTEYKEMVDQAEQKYKNWSSTSLPEQELSNSFRYEISKTRSRLESWLDNQDKGHILPHGVLISWEGALRWLEVAKSYQTNSGTLKPLEEKIESLRPSLERLKQDQFQLNERVPPLLQEISSLMLEKGIEANWFVSSIE